MCVCVSVRVVILMAVTQLSPTRSLGLRYWCGPDSLGLRYWCGPEAWASGTGVDLTAWSSGTGVDLTVEGLCLGLQTAKLPLDEIGQDLPHLHLRGKHTYLDVFV